MFQIPISDEQYTENKYINFKVINLTGSGTIYLSSTGDQIDDDSDA